MVAGSGGTWDEHRWNIRQGQSPLSDSLPRRSRRLQGTASMGSRAATSLSVTTPGCIAGPLARAALFVVQSNFEVGKGLRWLMVSYAEYLTGWWFY